MKMHYNVANWKIQMHGIIRNGCTVKLVSNWSNWWTGFFLSVFFSIGFAHSPFFVGYNPLSNASVDFYLCSYVLIMFRSKCFDWPLDWTRKNNEIHRSIGADSMRTPWKMAISEFGHSMWIPTEFCYQNKMEHFECGALDARREMSGSLHKFRSNSNFESFAPCMKWMSNGAPFSTGARLMQLFMI